MTNEPAPLTLLSTPKRFSGIFDIIQTNAITSWTRLTPRPEVILFGTDDGTEQICDRLGLTHVPEVARTAEGTPLLSDMWRLGQQIATTDVVCWSNADIIFTDALLDAARIVAERPRPALVVGRRVDLDITTPLDLDADRWQTDLARRAEADGERKPTNWIDYFLFPRGMFRDLPPFAIGRPGYDQWLIWQAGCLGADVIDATRFLLAVHQRHDYSHAGGRRAVFRGAEAERNNSMVEDFRQFQSIAHARLLIDAHGVVQPARGLEYRIARPKRYVAHALRFTRPLRQRLLGERATRRRSPAP